MLPPLVAASTYSDDSDIKLIVPGEGCVSRLPAGEGVSSLCFSPCGDYLAIGFDDGSISLMVPGELGARRIMAGHSSTVSALQFATLSGGRYTPSSGELLLFSGSTDGFICVWLVPSGTCARRMKHFSSVGCLAVSSDGSTLISGTRRVCVWDVDLGSFLCSHEQPNFRLERVKSIAFAGSEERFIVFGCDDGRVHLCDRRLGSVRTFCHMDGPVNCLCARGDYVFAGDDLELCAWELSTQRCHSLGGHSCFVYCACASDGFIVSGCDDGFICVRSAATPVLSSFSTDELGSPIRAVATCEASRMICWLSH